VKKKFKDNIDKNTINDGNLSQLRVFPILIMLGLILSVLFVAYDSTIAFGIAAISVLFFSQGFFINNHNKARVVEFLGHYIGTYFKPGMFITLPFSTKHVVSLKFQNINTEKIKMNDANGSSIEISVVIVWRVSSPAKAYYNVNNYYEFVFVQSDSVIRELANNYPYESDEEPLRKNSDKIFQVNCVQCYNRD
jgi:regulator of protease activity HflC (stomatin/prohibitin superfamily)